MPDSNETQVTAFEFPFPVPASFTAVADEDLAALTRQVIEFSTQYSQLQPHEHTAESVAALEASASLATRLNAVMQSRAATVNTANTSFAAIAALSDTAATFSAGDDEEEAEEEAEVLEGTVEPALTASRRSTAPGVREVARRVGAPVVPAQQVEARYAVMKTSADVPHFASGQELDTFGDAARALSSLMERYPTMTAARAKGQPNKRPITVYDPNGRKLVMERFSRHGGIQFVRQFPDDLRVIDGQGGYTVAEHASSERRLTGGSLIESAKRRIKNGKRGLTAAAAWCAASEVIYQLCELEGLDGLLSAPEMQTTRGGWQIPELGGPDFSSIWNGIGNAGDTHLTELEVQNDVAKVCTEIPCPDFENVRLGVDYVCLTGGLLQRRGYPEIVARFSRGAMVALAHKMNQGFIAAIVAASGAATVIPRDANGDDAASALLSGVELAITDMKYRQRMNFPTTLEVVMPMWFLAQIRAGLARRRGIKALDITDAEILDWFAIRKAMPQFVYDWQDAYTGLAGGPGGATPLEALPTSGQFLVYPTGTWVKAVQDVVSLDTIYDSTNLQTNQYTAIFAEDGWAALQMCPDSRLYEVTLDPSGVVGCCPSDLVSF